MTTLPPCRDFPTEVESYFCETCKESCSALSLVVGAHVGHKRRHLLPGIDTYPVLLWSKEAAEFRETAAHLVDSASTQWEQMKEQAAQATLRMAEIDAQIQQLQAERASLAAEVDEDRQRCNMRDTICAQFTELQAICVEQLVPQMRTSLAAVLMSAPELRATQKTLEVLADETLEACSNAREQLSTRLELQLPDEAAVAKKLGCDSAAAHQNRRGQENDVSQHQQQHQRGVSPAPVVPLGSRPQQQQQQRTAQGQDDSTISVDSLAREVILKNWKQQQQERKQDATTATGNDDGTETTNDMASPSSASSSSDDAENLVQVRYPATSTRRGKSSSMTRQQSVEEGEVKMTLAQLRQLISMQAPPPRSHRGDSSTSRSTSASRSSSSCRRQQQQRRRNQKRLVTEQQQHQSSHSHVPPPRQNNDTSNTNISGSKHHHVPAPSSSGADAATARSHRRPDTTITDVSLTSITSGGDADGRHSAGFTSDSSVLWEALTRAKAQHDSAELKKRSRSRERK